MGLGYWGGAALRMGKGDIVWVHAALIMALIAFSRNPMEYGFLRRPDTMPESAACFRDRTLSTFTLTRCLAGSEKCSKQPCVWVPSSSGDKIDITKLNRIPAPSIVDPASKNPRVPTRQAGGGPHKGILGATCGDAQGPAHAR